MDEYCMFLRNIKVVELKRVLRAYGLCEYGLRSTLIERLESLLLKEVQQQVAAVSTPQTTTLHGAKRRGLEEHGGTYEYNHTRVSTESRGNESDSDISISSRCSLEGAIPSVLKRRARSEDSVSSCHSIISCTSSVRESLQSPPSVYASIDPEPDRRELLGEGFQRRQHIYERLSSGSESEKSPGRSSKTGAEVVGIRLNLLSDTRTLKSVPVELAGITDDLLNLRTKPKARRHLSGLNTGDNHVTNLEPKINQLVNTPTAQQQHDTSPPSTRRNPVKTKTQEQSLSTSKPSSPNTKPQLYPTTVFDYDTRLVHCSEISPVDICCATTSPSPKAVESVPAELVTAEVTKTPWRVGIKPKPVAKTIQSKLTVPWKAIQQKVKSKLFGKSLKLAWKSRKTSTISAFEEVHVGEDPAAIGKSYKRLLTGDDVVTSSAPSPAKKQKTDDEAPTSTLEATEDSQISDHQPVAKPALLVSQNIASNDTQHQPTSVCADKEIEPEEAGTCEPVMSCNPVMSCDTSPSAEELLPLPDTTDDEAKAVATTEVSEPQMECVTKSEETEEPAAETSEVTSTDEVVDAVSLVVYEVSDGEDLNNCEPPPPGLDVIPLPTGPPISKSNKKTSPTTAGGKPSATVSPMVKQDLEVPNASVEDKVTVGPPTSQTTPYGHQQYQGHGPYQWSGYNHHQQAEYYNQYNNMTPGPYHYGGGGPGYPPYPYQNGAMGQYYNTGPPGGPHHNADLMGAWNNGWNQWYS